MIRRLWRALRPVDGVGMGSWAYCDATVRGEVCVLREPHLYRHVTSSGFRFAEAVA